MALLDIAHFHMSVFILLSQADVTLPGVVSDFHHQACADGDGVGHFPVERVAIQVEVKVGMISRQVVQGGQYGEQLAVRHHLAVTPWGVG